MTSGTFREANRFWRVREARSIEVLGNTEAREVDKGLGHLRKHVGGHYAKRAYVEPTVFADVDPGGELAQEEIFRPALSIIRFSDEAEAVRIANGTKYGLGAYLRTQDLERAHRVAGELQAGRIFINDALPVEPDTAFGGIGASGYGREGGKVGIEEFLTSQPHANTPGTEWI